MFWARMSRRTVMTTVLVIVVAVSGQDESMSVMSTKKGNQNIGIGIPFTSCGNSGPIGPTQHQCAIEYNNRSKVRVIDKGPLQGIQVWEVPSNKTYSITALGAEGGSGVQNTATSHGGYAYAKFNLTAGDHIYMLIGQKGEKACSMISLAKPQTKRQCQHGASSINGPTPGGGGGGGGGTFVFRKDRETGRLIPLVVAGGGGGKSYLTGSSSIKDGGGFSEMGPGTTAETLPNSPGAGGGWEGRNEYQQTGGSLLQGGKGGHPCPKAKDFGWEHSGGFGGGGGGCTAGGGGGGFTGGNVSLSDNPEYNGQGGSSYINSEGADPRLVAGTGSHSGHGEVEIAVFLDCECEFMCIYQDYDKRIFECYCPPNTILAADRLHCMDPSDTPEAPTRRSMIVAIVLGCLGILVCTLTIIVCIAVHSKKKRRPQSIEHLTNPDYQLGRLRTVVATQHANMAVLQYNPNYDFGGAKCKVQDLPEIPRDRLTLIKGLGQGAFGEVYQGELSAGPPTSSLVRVAIKTLPALCTNQAEMDFLMEALIMSKFNHPNIVQFIGVCFEKHPRFIVLELLEGGDLKTFLREARPKLDAPVAVTAKELLKLSIDVARGCHYLEDNHFIHRDIAARNCLLTEKGPGKIAKIADFGMARDIYRADYYRKGGKAMLPVKWMPPEAFLDGIFTSKTDVWSFGILLWEVFSLGFMPYPGRGNQEVMELVTAGGRLDPPQHCPSPITHIMNVCWHGIPERRPTFVAIIQKLELAMESREVIEAVLPVFDSAVVQETNKAIMRPREDENVVLTVDPPPKCLDPDSPLSTDQLISPMVPDYNACGRLQKTANLSISAQSLDRLLKDEPGFTVGSRPSIDPAQGAFHFEDNCRVSALAESPKRWRIESSHRPCSVDWMCLDDDSGLLQGEDLAFARASREPTSAAQTGHSALPHNTSREPTRGHSVVPHFKEEHLVDREKVLYQNTIPPSSAADRQRDAESVSDPMIQDDPEIMDVSHAATDVCQHNM